MMTRFRSFTQRTDQPVFRRARLEAVALHRSLRAWIPLFLLIWVVSLRVQEPAFVRGSGIPFFWAGVESALLLVVGLIPVAWILCRRPEASAWTLRLARTASSVVVSCWLGVVGYGLFVAALAVGTGLMLDALYGTPLDLARPGVVLLESVLFLAPISALAPAVSYASLGPALIIVVWLVLLGACLAQGFPVPTGSLLALEKDDVALGSLTVNACLPALQATAAGLLLSVGLARRRMRPT